MGTTGVLGRLKEMIFAECSAFIHLLFFGSHRELESNGLQGYSLHRGRLSHCLYAILFLRIWGVRAILRFVPQVGQGCIAHHMLSKLVPPAHGHFPLRQYLWMNGWIL